MDEVSSQFYRKNNTVGSDEFIDFVNNHFNNSLDKIIFTLDSLDAHLNKSNDLALNFDYFYNDGPNSLQPISSFWNIFSEWVIDAIPEKLSDFKKEKLNYKLHQLRYAFDKINIDFIRTNFKDYDMTDVQALQAYESTLPIKLRSQRSSDRYHNKINGLTHHFFYDGRIIKRVFDFHVEFVFDQQGNFLSIYESNFKNNNSQDLTNIVNSTSFNYGRSNDLKQLGSLHGKLDVIDAKYDYTVRYKTLKKYKVTHPTLNDWSTVPRQLEYRQLQKEYDDGLSKKLISNTNLITVITLIVIILIVILLITYVK